MSLPASPSSPPPSLRFRLLEKFTLLLADGLAGLRPRTLARVGSAAGWLLLLSPTMRKRIQRHLRYAGLAQRLPLHTVCAHIGQMAVEAMVTWRMTLAQVLAGMQEVSGWQAVVAARAARPVGQRGIIFITPHIGNYELSSLWIGAQTPMTVMFRAPKQPWGQRLMRQGRERSNINTVNASMAGVRSLFKTLKNDGAIGILPDQNPAQGKGVWVPFFGHPAYTTTLVHKLAKHTGATLIMFCCTRRAPGLGYAIQFTPLPPLSDDAALAATELNQALEAVILQAPEQYLWSYNRYKGKPQ